MKNICEIIFVTDKKNKTHTQLNLSVVVRCLVTKENPVAINTAQQKVVHIYDLIGIEFPYSSTKM